jgi:hypothetical protein
MAWPNQIIKMADQLASTNPRFDRKKFIDRATKAWEAANPMEPMDDYIPYDNR